MKSCVMVSMFAALFLGHCRPRDKCALGATRCWGNTAEICDADGSFHELSNCNLVSEQSGAPFVCALFDEETEDGRLTGHTCLPADSETGDEQ